MSRFHGRHWCQNCGKYEGSGDHADRIIVLERIGKRRNLLCQFCRPKAKPVEVPPDTAQLSFEEKVEK